VFLGVSSRATPKLVQFVNNVPFPVLAVFWFKEKWTLSKSPGMFLATVSVVLLSGGVFA